MASEAFENTRIPGRERLQTVRERLRSVPRRRKTGRDRFSTDSMSDAQTFDGSRSHPERSRTVPDGLGSNRERPKTGPERLKPFASACGPSREREKPAAIGS